MRFQGCRHTLLLCRFPSGLHDLDHTVFTVLFHCRFCEKSIKSASFGHHQRISHPRPGRLELSKLRWEFDPWLRNHIQINRRTVVIQLVLRGSSASVQSLIILGAIPVARVGFGISLGLLIGGFVVANLVGGLWGIFVFVLLLIYLVIYTFIKIS